MTLLLHLRVRGHAGDKELAVGPTVTTLMNRNV